MPIDAGLPDDSIIVADGGDFVGTASYIVRPRGPLEWLDPGAFGTLGCGEKPKQSPTAVFSFNYPSRIPESVSQLNGKTGYSNHLVKSTLQ